MTRAPALAGMSAIARWRRLGRRRSWPRLSVARVSGVEDGLFTLWILADAARALSCHGIEILLHVMLL
jgi:hypothetical protein